MLEVFIFFKDEDNSYQKFKKIETKIWKEFSKNFIFRKINLNFELELSKKYNIKDLPSIIILKDGKLIRNINGFITEENLVNILTEIKNKN